MTALPRQAIASHGIGASEIAAALGLSPYKSTLELWLEKTGQRPPFTGNDATEWGQDVEPSLREWYVRRHERAVWVPAASLFHPEHPWMRATPDGIVLDPDSPHAPDDKRGWLHGFEAKNVGFRSAHRWGEAGSDEVPIEYLLQAQQGLAVTGLGRWDIVASIGGQPPTVYPIHRDDELVAMLIESGETFWELVQAGKEPPIDDAPAWADYLAERYPFTRNDYVPADDLTERRALELKKCRDAIAAMEANKARLENEIKSAIGEHAGVETSLGRITWKPQKGRTIVDWETVARTFAAGCGPGGPGALETLVAEHTRQGKGCRPMRVPNKWSQGRVEE